MSALQRTLLNLATPLDILLDLIDFKFDLLDIALSLPIALLT